MRNWFLVFSLILILTINGCTFGVIFFPVVGSDGTVYVTENKNLYALNPDKTLKWKYTARSKLSRRLALGNDNTIYVAGLEGGMFAINPDGTTKWRKIYEKFSELVPATVKDTIIYVVLGENLCAMNLNGTKKWKFPTGNKIYSPAVFDSNGNIYVVTSDNNLYAINPDGTRKWKLSAKINAFISPFIGNDNTIYVCSTDGNLYALNPEGKVKWNKIYGYVSTVISNDSTVYVGADTNLYALSLDGKVKWEYIIKERVGSLFTTNDSNVCAITFSQEFICLNPDGTKKWSSSFLGGWRFSPPAMDNNGNIYIGSNDGNLYAINADGTLKWEFSGY